MRTVLADLLIREKALEVLLENGFFTKFLSTKQTVRARFIEFVFKKNNAQTACSYVHTHTHTYTSVIFVNRNETEIFVNEKITNPLMQMKREM